MSAARPLPAPVDPSTMDHFVYLRVDWQGYEQLLAMRGESSVPRFFALRAEADGVYREIPRSELLPELPIDVLLACMKEPDQTSAVRALRAALASV